MSSGPRYKRKKDMNHNTLAAQLADVPGVYVQDVSMYPGLGFDLIARRLDGAVKFLEIKPARKVTELTESEQAARERYVGLWHVVTTVEEALAVLEAQP